MTARGDFEKAAKEAFETQSIGMDIDGREEIETLKLLASTRFAQIFGIWPDQVQSVNKSVPRRVRVQHAGHTFTVFCDLYSGLNTNLRDCYVTWQGKCPSCKRLTVSDDITSLGDFGKMLAEGFAPGPSHYLDDESCDGDEAI